jgi:hypothetical protein
MKGANAIFRAAGWWSAQVGEAGAADVSDRDVPFYTQLRNNSIMVFDCKREGQRNA